MTTFEKGDLPQECVYEAGKSVVRRYYRNLAELQEIGNVWSESFFIKGEDPRVKLAGLLAVVFDMDADERPLKVFEELVTGRLALTKAERDAMRGLRCGEVFDTVRTVKSLMPAVMNKADRLFKKLTAEGDA